MSSPKTYHSIVLVKQVPDTRQVTGDAMTPEGTLNRGLLPAIFNPEDLNALEMALEVRDRHGGQVTVVTMGPPQAAEVLREALYRGADGVILLTDRKFAGADTLATSYALQKAVEKLAPYDFVFCGRQAIDGDTAQVGPQVAEKLGVPQITYAERIVRLDGDGVVVQRAFDQGTELVKSPLPCLLTVVGSARPARPPSVRRRLEYKLAATPLEYAARLKAWPEFETEAALDAYLAARRLRIPVWTAADLEADESRLGLAGSPTQVHKINFVVLEARESKAVSPTADGLRALVQELIKEYVTP